MKSYLTLITCLFISVTGFTQSVILKKDIIYKDEIPYAKLVKTSSLIPRFSIRNLEDEELASAKYNNEEQRYTITFFGSGQQCYMEGTIGFGKILAKDVVAANLIVDNKISPEGEKRFLLEHKGSMLITQQPVYGQAPATIPDGYDATYQTVERNRLQPLMMFGTTIKQDNTTIGSYSVNTTAKDGILVKVFAFFLPNSVKIAEAYVEGVNARTARLVILKNNQVVNISLKFGDQISVAKEIAEYLSGRYFL